MCDNISYFPGPISLIFGSESSLHSDEITRFFPSRKRPLYCTSIPSQPVHHLSLLGCQFVDIKDTFRILGKKLRRENHLEELAICNTTPKLSNAEMANLAHGLSKNSNLRLLDLTGADVNAKGFLKIKPFLEKNSSLQVLVLGENASVGDDGLHVILSSIQKGGHSLRALNLESCGLRKFGPAVPELMKTVGSSLRILDLSGNTIGDAGVEKLAESMKNNQCKLEYLGLKNTSVGDYGLLKLSDGLATDRTLHTLYLQSNPITDIGARHILKSIYNTDSISAVIGSNHFVKNIDLSGCKCSIDLINAVRVMSDQTVRFKMSKYFETFGCVSALGAIDSVLLPNLLSFVGKKNGLDVLFRTIRSIPLLYNQIQPVTKIRNTSTPFKLNGSTPTSKRSYHYGLFLFTIPRVRVSVRLMDGRGRCRQESRTKKSSNNYLDKVHHHSIL